MSSVFVRKERETDVSDLYEINRENITAPAKQTNRINPFLLFFSNTDSTDSTDFFRKAQQATQVSLALVIDICVICEICGQ